MGFFSIISERYLNNDRSSSSYEKRYFNPNFYIWRVCYIQNTIGDAAYCFEDEFDRNYFLSTGIIYQQYNYQSSILSWFLSVLHLFPKLLFLDIV